MLDGSTLRWLEKGEFNEIVIHFPEDEISLKMQTKDSDPPKTKRNTSVDHRSLKLKDTLEHAL